STQYPSERCPNNNAHDTDKSGELKGRAGFRSWQPPVFRVVARNPCDLPETTATHVFQGYCQSEVVTV
ncbi:MAG: hypothetical protein MUF25_01360, partial [Pirellulaceae bacterium]|nr:hypothetical protein [Pirellulaceae bacterium]